LSPETAPQRAACQKLGTKVLILHSAEQAVVALLDLSASKLSDDELNRLSKLIDHARKEGR
jgi:hypothetical protein